MRDQLYREWNEMQCLGRIMIAEEGINAQMSVPDFEFENFMQKLYEKEQFKDVPVKVAVEDGVSFLKLAIKVRKQLVVCDNEEGYDVFNVGHHLDAKGMASFIRHPSFVLHPSSFILLPSSFILHPSSFTLRAHNSANRVLYP